MKYLITESQLNEMVNFGIKHPDTEFHSEPMSDGAEFLSCTFFDKNDNNASGFWELDDAKERFIQRYKDSVNNYLDHNNSDEGNRALLYISQEYEMILQDEFKVSHEEIRAIYDELYWKHYGKEKKS